MIVGATNELANVPATILPSLINRSFEITIRLAITRTGTAGIEFKIFGDPSTVGADGELANAIEQTISVKFSKAHKSSAAAE